MEDAPEIIAALQESRDEEERKRNALLNAQDAMIDPGIDPSEEAQGEEEEDEKAPTTEYIVNFEAAHPMRCTLRRQRCKSQGTGNDRGTEGELEEYMVWETVWAFARAGRAGELKKLLESNKRLCNLRNMNNDTALHFAAANGHFKCVAVLVELGSLSFTNDQGDTPVKLAVDGGHSDVVRYLCSKNHIGTEPEHCQKLLTWALNRKDVVTSSILQKHIDPILREDEEKRERKRVQDPLKQKVEDEKEIQRIAQEIWLKAQPPIPLPLPPYGNPLTWDPHLIIRWVKEQFPQEVKTVNMNVVLRYHITGKVLFTLTKGEMTTMFQRIGIPTHFRKKLVEALLVVQNKDLRYGFTEKRTLAVALGCGMAFRIIGTIQAAMSTPLQTCRRFVTTAKDLERELPSPFQFTSMQDVRVPREKEGSFLVAHMGFVIIIQPDKSFDKHQDKAQHEYEQEEEEEDDDE